MAWPQTIFGILLVLALAGVAVGFGWRRLLTLRRVPATPGDENQFARRLALRRLINSVLLLVLGGMLVGLLFLEEPARQLAEYREALYQQGESVPLQGDARDFARAWALYWIAFLSILFVVLMLALVDVVAIRRYARRQFQKIHDDRRAMIRRQASRMRQEREGPPDVSVN